MPQEHLLIATLGESPGALSLFDWLNRRASWPEPRRSLAPPGATFTHLWVITTSSKQIEPEVDLLVPLTDPAFAGVEAQIGRVRTPRYQHRCRPCCHG